MSLSNRRRWRSHISAKPARLSTAADFCLLPASQRSRPLRGRRCRSAPLSRSPEITTNGTGSTAELVLTFLARQLYTFHEMRRYRAMAIFRATPCNTDISSPLGEADTSSRFSLQLSIDAPVTGVEASGACAAIPLEAIDEGGRLASGFVSRRGAAHVSPSAVGLPADTSFSPSWLPASTRTVAATVAAVEYQASPHAALPINDDAAGFSQRERLAPASRVSSRNGLMPAITPDAD